MYGAERVNCLSQVRHPILVCWLLHLSARINCSCWRPQEDRCFVFCLFVVLFSDVSITFWFPTELKVYLKSEGAQCEKSLKFWSFVHALFGNKICIQLRDTVFFVCLFSINLIKWYKCHSGYSYGGFYIRIFHIFPLWMMSSKWHFIFNTFTVLMCLQVSTICVYLCAGMHLPWHASQVRKLPWVVIAFHISWDSLVVDCYVFQASWLVIFCLFFPNVW